MFSLIARYILLDLVVPVLLLGISPVLKVPELGDPYADYRKSAKTETMLGSLSTPLSILLKDGSVYGIDNDNNLSMLDISVQLSQDRVRQIYFDIFSDKLFYIINTDLHIYDFHTATDSIVTGDLQTLLNDESCGQQSPQFGLEIPDCLQTEIAGVHNNFITLSIQNSQRFITFDLVTGQEVVRTEAAGYDMIRGFEFFHADKKLRLTLNTKADGPSTGTSLRTGGTITQSVALDHIDFYLQEVPATPIDLYAPVNNRKWADPIWTLGYVPALRELEPFYTYSDEYTKDFIASQGSLYRLNDQRLAAEINGVLAVINLDTLNVEILNDAVSIESTLSNAVLLFADQGDLMQWSHCNENDKHNDYIHNLTSTQGYEFIFCIK
jgi:hypothetical protein